MGQNSFVKTAFVFSSTLTLSLIVSALPSFAQTSLQTHLSEADKPYNADQSVQTLVEIEIPLEAATVENFVEEITTVPTVNPTAALASDEATEAPIATSAENSEAAMSEFVKALSSDMAEAQAASTETSTETPGEVAAGTSAGLEAEVTASTLEEQLESIQEANAPASASAIGDLASVGVDSFTVEADSVPALKAALNSDNVLTQLYAADALWTLTGDSELILPTLISAATSDDFRVRDLATSGLAYLGRRALPAVPVLNQLLGNNDSKTRGIAQTTLDIIRSSNRPATTLGILARESRRLRVVPSAVRAITRLWR